MTSFFNNPCDLHIPYKRWSGDTREENNYHAIERWAYGLRACYDLPEPETMVALTTATPRARGGVHHAYFQGLVTVPSDNSGTYVDFRDLDADHVLGSISVNPSDGQLDVPGGAVLLHGFVEMESIPATTPGIAYGTINTFGSLHADRRRLMGYSDGGTGTTFHLGGAYYSPYGFHSTMTVQQNMGVTMAVNVHFSLAVMEAY